MPRSYRCTAPAEVLVPALNRVVQPGEVVESDIELSGPFVPVEDQAPQKDVAATPREVTRDAGN